MQTDVDEHREKRAYGGEGKGSGQILVFAQSGCKTWRVLLAEALKYMEEWRRGILTRA